MDLKQENSGNGALQIGSLAEGASVTHKVFTLFNLTVSVSVRHRHQQDQTPEYQQQAEFKRATGIDGGPEFRAWLNHLMEKHQFTASELRNARRNHTIGWNKDTNTPWVKTHWWEAFVAWLGLAMATCWTSLYALLIASGQSPDGTGWKYPMATASLAGLYGFSCWLLNRGLLAPRRTALRIRKALGWNDNSQGERK